VFQPLRGLSNCWRVKSLKRCPDTNRKRLAGGTPALPASRLRRLGMTMSDGNVRLPADAADSKGPVFQPLKGLSNCCRVDIAQAMS
jgi:hypothetical protein